MSRRVFAVRMAVYACVMLAAVGCWEIISRAEHALVVTQNEYAQQEVRATKQLNDLKKEVARKHEIRRHELTNEILERARRGDSTPPVIEAYDCRSSRAHSNMSALDVIVNKKQCSAPLAYAPQKLATVDGIAMDVRTAEALSRMRGDMERAGLGILITSGYRSYAEQATLYGQLSTIYDAAKVESMSARPGYSEHQTGLAVDVMASGCALECFAATPAYAWLREHAHEYGFVERYPAGKKDVTGYAHEPWHYRYVGEVTAREVKKRAVTLEEYWNSAGGDY